MKIKIDRQRILIRNLLYLETNIYQKTFKLNTSSNTYNTRQKYVLDFSKWYIEWYIVTFEKGLTMQTLQRTNRER